MRRKRVLYAEDDYLNGKLLEILLEQTGIECVVAGDGSEAVRLFENGAYDAVIIDAYLPGLNGEAVARSIRRLDEAVLLIGVTSEAGAAHCMEQAGFDRVFMKPFRGRVCLDYLLRHL